MVEVLNRLSKAKGFKGLSRGFVSQPGLRALSRDQRGVIIVMFALMLPIFLGFIGLGVEVGYWFQKKRDLQAAADAAALAGAYEIAEGRSSGVQTIANREAVNNGYTGTVTVRSFPVYGNYPASPSAYSADPDAIQVEVTETVARLFSSFFMSSDMTITAKAVGDVVAGASSACVLALGSSNAAKSLWVLGSATVSMSGCSASTNSTNSAAVTTTSGLSVDCVYSAGGISGTPTTTQCSGAQSNQPAVTDPYESLTKPVASDFDNCGSDGSNADGNSYTDPNTDDSISAGVYCGINYSSNNDTLTMGAGTYYIDRGNFTSTGGTIDGTAGVTIVFGDSTWDGTAGTANCGGVSFTGNSNVLITAPDSSSGESFPGLTFYRSSICDDDEEIKIAGNNDSTVFGAIYNPSGEIKITGNGAVGGTCLQLVSDTIKISGNSNIGSTCPSGSGVLNIAAGGIGSLVE